MKTIRRYYFYIVSLVSLEVVVWAVIWLIRTMFSQEIIGGMTNRLATALSYILVAVPVFLIHWNWVRKDVAQEEGQRSGGLRAFFLHLTSLVLWVPVVQNLLAIILRVLGTVMGVTRYNFIFGADQSWGDNLAGILVNLVFAVYVQKVIQEDQKSTDYDLAGRYFQRIWWYLIALYPMVMTFFGVQEITYYILSNSQTVVPSSSGLINGLGFLIVGFPLWIWLWTNLNKTFREDVEPILVRQIAITLKYLVFLIMIFSMSVEIISQLISDLFDISRTGNYHMDFSYLLPAVIFWVYFNRIVKSESPTWNALLNWVYLRFVTLVSLIASFVGLGIAGWNLIELVAETSIKEREFLQVDLINGFALFLVWGIAWWFYWKPRVERDEVGLSDGQILVERIYLYIVVAAGVIGGMVSAAGFLYVIIQALLEGVGRDFISDLATSFYLLILFAVLLWYHLGFLRKYTKKADEVKQLRQVGVLSFEPISSLSKKIVKLAEGENKFEVVMHNAKDGLPGPDEDIQLLMIGSDKLNDLSNDENKYLEGFSGKVVVIPQHQENWLYLGTEDSEGSKLEVNLMRLIEKSATGEDLKIDQKRSIWEIFGYLFVVVVGVGFLCILANILIEAASGF